MIIFLYGTDTYRSKEELRKIIGENKKINPDWLDFLRIDVDGKEIEVFKELKQTTDTVSMFGAKKLIIIENIFPRQAQDKLQEEVLELLKKKNIEKNDEIKLVFWCEEIDAQNQLYKYLISKAQCKEFKPLQGAQLRNWIKDYATKRGGKIDSQAIDALMKYLDNDLWRLSNEIDKLIAHNDNQAIKVADVDLFIKPEINPNIFEMVDAIGYKNKAKALKLFNQHIEDGEDEHYLLSMAVYQIRNLLKAKTAQTIELLGLNPFVARKTEEQIGNFSYEELKKIYHQLMAIDFESKLGKTDIRIALEKFIVDL